MTTTDNNNNNRLANTTTCFPIAYGSIAFYLGKQATDETKTHKWTLYVRHPDPTYDLSKAISKVIFQLHPSFPQPTRELTCPPYEVTEMGWGEFEASIRIIWRDDDTNGNYGDNERPILLTHLIKLYPNNAPSATADPSTYMNTAVPVVSEKYDEVVFTNPKISFHKQLLDGEATTSNNNSNNNKKKKNTKKLSYPLSKEQAVIEHFRTYGDEHDVKAMLAAKEFLQRELRNVKDRLIKVDEELEDVKGQLLVASTTAAATSTTGGSAASGTSGGGVTSLGGTTKQESGKTSSSTTAGTGKTSSSKSGSKKKKASASNAGGGSGSGGGSGEPASKKAKSS